MKKYKIVFGEANPNSISKHPILEFYNCLPVSETLRSAYKKGIPLDRIIVTADNKYLNHPEAVEIASSLKRQSISIARIKNLTEDEVPQIFPFINFWREASYRSKIRLIQYYLDYLKNNPAGKVWAKTLPGASIKEKVAGLVHVGYGTVYHLLEIYKFCPELVEALDNGERGFREVRDIAIQRNLPETSPDGGNDSSPSAAQPPIPPTRRHAGSKNFILCEPLQGIEVRLANGSVVRQDQSTGKMVLVNPIGDQVELISKSEREPFEDGAQFHQYYNPESEQFIEVILKGFHTT